MARSLGPRLRRLIHRAARTSSAVESGPPDTARISPGNPSRPRNRAPASPSETASSAVGTLLFPIHALLHIERGARVFAQHFAERSAGRFFFAKRRERHSEFQQRVGCARVRVVFGRDGEEGFRGVAILLTLEQALAEPVLRLWRQPIARMLFQEGAE